MYIDTSVRNRNMFSEINSKFRNCIKIPEAVFVQFILKSQENIKILTLNFPSLLHITLKFTLFRFDCDFNFTPVSELIGL